MKLSTIEHLSISCIFQRYLQSSCRIVALIVCAFLRFSSRQIRGRLCVRGVSASGLGSAHAHVTATAANVIIIISSSSKRWLNVAHGVFFIFFIDAKSSIVSFSFF